MSRRVHLVGIAGAGMSAIARVLHERGESVSGSDRERSPYSEALQASGVRVHYGHQAGHIAGADLLVVSSAIPAENPEVRAAEAAGVPVLRRNAFLGELTRGLHTTAVAGTHGKTTTTGWIAWVLDQAGLAPGFIAGGLLPDLGGNARAGAGRHFVIEADEYDRAFLALTPDVAVVTSVEHDHPDCYPTPHDFQQAFEAFAARVTGRLIVCADDPGAAALHGGDARSTYGLARPAEWRAEEIRPNVAGGSDFLALQGEATLGLVRTRLPGLHNVRNALAVLAAADAAGVSFSDARRAMTEFRGAARRFEVIGEAGGITVVDDYAHHPGEIRATLQAARARYPEAAIWAVFQPHTYSRARALREGFAEAFEQADHVVVTEIYAAREAPDPSLSGAALAAGLRHDDVRFIPALPDAARFLQDQVRAPALVVTMSAGDGNLVGRLLLQALAG